MSFPIVKRPRPIFLNTKRCSEDYLHQVSTTLHGLFLICIKGKHNDQNFRDFPVAKPRKIRAGYLNPRFPDPDLAPKIPGVADPLCRRKNPAGIPQCAMKPDVVIAAFGKNEQRKERFPDLLVAIAGLVLIRVVDPVTAQQIAGIILGVVP